MTTEVKGSHPQFLMFNSLIREARRSSDPRYTPEELIRHLIYQGPNRIYCDNLGQIARVVFFRGGFSHEAYIETVRIDPNRQSLQVIRSEFFTGATVDDLENEVAHWKARWSMQGNLLHDPEYIFRNRESGEFTHIVGNTFCRYDMSPYGGPRIAEIGTGDSKVAPKYFEVLTAPPSELVAYAYPF